MDIISIINMKGGVAKTTLAVNLADCLSRRHSKKVLIVDVDPQFNATQCIFSPDRYVAYLKKGGDTILNVFDRPRPTATAVDGPEVKKIKKIADVSPYRVNKNLYILPSNLELYRLEMAPGEGRENRLKIYLDTLKNTADFDFALIDTPPTPSVFMTSALIASDYYLIPVKPDPISITGIDLLRGIINDKKENFDLKIKCLGLIFTIVEENTTVYHKAKLFMEGDEYWKKYLFKKFLPKRTRIALKQATQEHILDTSDANLKNALTGITIEMLERLDQNGK